MLLAGANGIKRLTTIIDKYSYKTIVFIPGRCFKSSVKFVSKAEANLSGTLVSSCLLGQAYGLANKNKTRLETLARDKQSSQIRPFVNYGRKRFYNIGPLAVEPGSGSFQISSQ
jgi:hypothetical protein